MALLQLADNQKLINHVDADAGRQVIPCKLLVCYAGAVVGKPWALTQASQQSFSEPILAAREE